MARIAGVNLPNKPTWIALTYIHGIGQTTAKKICETTGVSMGVKIDNLADEELGRIRDLIDDEYRIEGELRREVSMNIKRLMDLGCYRGLRHRRGMPARGQRTHTNARTRKGRARPITGKR